MENEPVLKVQNLSLTVQIPLFEPTSLKETFTSLFKDPFQDLDRSPQFKDLAKNLNFQILRGERVGLVGINGAGKTSLCRCLAGMFAPDSGKIIRNSPVRAIFDTSLGVLPELTGRENALLLAHFLYPGHKDIFGIVSESLAFSGLEEYADAPYRIYSNGMKARLFLSIISSQPAGLLILDEVFDGADVFFQKQIETRILRMVESSDAVIFVSHNEEQILKVCERVMVLSQGHLVFDGKPEPALRYYRSHLPRPESRPIGGSARTLG
ncbi:MAG: ATP-binding cassette domain-containing protein [Bdellovibrionales bacterium]|nr:ATP-binding cassette domain-containing protein [Bdellovibrionales bacterium]